MITYLYGTDTYRIKEYLREHAPDAMVGEEGLKYQGLFDRRPVILYEAPVDLKISDDLEVFVVSEKKIKKGIEFQPLKGAEIGTWIQERLKKTDFAIAPDALAMLTDRYTGTWQMKIELDKLCNHGYDKKMITANDIAAVGTAKTEEKIFALTDAVSSKNKRDACLLLDRQLSSGADPFYLFSMIAGQFRNMLAPKRSGVHPYAAHRAEISARRFAPNELKSLYRRLHQLELDAKSGTADIVDGLYKFIFKLGI